MITEFIREKKMGSVVEFVERVSPDDYTYQPVTGVWQVAKHSSILPGALTDDPEQGASELNAYLSTQSPDRNSQVRQERVVEMAEAIIELYPHYPPLFSDLAGHLLRLHNNHNSIESVQKISSIDCSMLPADVQRRASELVMAALMTSRVSSGDLPVEVITRFCALSEKRPTLHVI